MWFTERSGNRIGKITSTGEITEYLIPTASSQPGGITAGPGRALWFTEQTGNRIGRITTAGEITEFVLPRASSGPLGITAGPDGALWFTEVGTAGNRIGRITTAGQVTEYPLVFSGRHRRISPSGPDGNLWFTERAGNAVGRITPGGSIEEFVLPSSLPNPVGIAAGPDGNVWFAELGSNNIGRIAPDGTIKEFPLPNPNSQPFGIALGIDGAMWFTEAAGNRIGRIVVQVAPPPDLTPPTVTITTPADGAVYTVGQVVLADYDCTDEAGGSGLATCAGPVANGDPIDSSLGTHTFTVNATDVAGNPGGASSTYLVTVPPDLRPPTVTITTPADGAVYTVGQVVLADYGCTDETGGSGFATCAGPVANGASDRHVARHPHVHSERDRRGRQRGGCVDELHRVGRFGRPTPPRPGVERRDGCQCVDHLVRPGIVAGSAVSKRQLRGKPGKPGGQALVPVFAAGFPVANRSIAETRVPRSDRRRRRTLT